MKLIKQSDLEKELNLVVNQIEIEEGSGVFLIAGGSGKEEKNIKVYYHSPKSYSRDSKILIVIPGAGRNGDSYRDAWIEASEKHNVLILSPMYAEEDYPFTEYHLGGIIYNSNIFNCIAYQDDSNIVRLDEDKFSFEIAYTSEHWIFDDFDSLFQKVVLATHSTQKSYDIFGHSAGGQILHRMALFHPSSKANRIIAGNSGFYTLPSYDIDLPFGLGSSKMEKEELKKSFENKLVVMVGELDNANEDGGTLLRSPTVDQQGLHRLERGRYFFDYAKQAAEELGATFIWELNIVPNVGHNQRLMAAAAASFLYEGKKQ